MKPFEVQAVVLCDDIRQEISGKYVLVGVYGADIVVPGFPTQLFLSWWMMISPKIVGSLKGSVRILHSGGATLTQGEVNFEVKDLQNFTSTLTGVPVQFQNEGQLQLQLNFEGKWETIHELEVKLKPSSV